MKQIKAIFFDIGGVLVKVDSQRAVEQLAVELDISEASIKEAMSPELLTQYKKGHLNSNQFYENLLLKCKSAQKMDINTFKDYWKDVLFPMPEMIPFMERASQKKYPVWLLSNTNDFHYDLLLQKFEFMNWVDGGTYSFMEGSMKPEALIYQKAIFKSGIRPENILFIDDLEANILAARDQGLNAIHFSGYSNFKSDIESQFPDLGHLL